jgi:hypothetical protein
MVLAIILLQVHHSEVRQLDKALIRQPVELVNLTAEVMLVDGQVHTHHKHHQLQAAVVVRLDMQVMAHQAEEL